MKAVLLSIHPKWCELIALGKKTVEVRKTKPKIEVPFKCYIYCTNAKGRAFFTKGENGNYAPARLGNGKIIGSFVCDKIFDIPYILPFDSDDNYHSIHSSVLKFSCLTEDDIDTYLGNRNGYGWQISDFKIYDNPRKLSEFYVEGDCDCMNCKSCAWFDKGNGFNVEDDCSLAYKGVEQHKSFKPIMKPPQSWMYVEGENNDKIFTI